MFKSVTREAEIQYGNEFGRKKYMHIVINIVNFVVTQ